MNSSKGGELTYKIRKVGEYPAPQPSIFCKLDEKSGVCLLTLQCQSGPRAPHCAIRVPCKAVARSLLSSRIRFWVNISGANFLLRKIEPKESSALLAFAGRGHLACSCWEENPKSIFCLFQISTTRVLQVTQLLRMQDGSIGNCCPLLGACLGPACWDDDKRHLTTRTA